MNAFDLSGKVAIITGATRGIGKSIAQHLAAAGASVVVSSRTAQACEEVAQSIRDSGAQAIGVAANISKKPELEALVRRTLEHWGRVDVLVANAASNPYYGPMTGASDEVFDKVMRNNVQSNMWLANMVLPGMAERKDGAVIFVGSIGGFRGRAALGIYGMSKAAEMQMAHQLHCARTDSHRLLARHLGEPQAAGRARAAVAAGSHWRARRYRRHCAFAGQQGRRLYHWSGHHRRRR